MGAPGGGWFLIGAGARAEGPRPDVWCDRLEREEDRVRAALEWCLEHDPELGRDLGGALWPFWMNRSRDKYDLLTEDARTKSLDDALATRVVRRAKIATKPSHVRALTRTTGRNPRLSYHAQIRGRRGESKAIGATRHDILVAYYHIVRDGVPFRELGPDCPARRYSPEHRARRLVRQLEALGLKVTLEAAA